MSEDGGFTDDRSANASGSVDDLLSEIIQGWNAASQVVEATLNGAVSTALLVQEFSKRLPIASAAVSHGVCLVILTLPKNLMVGNEETPCF